MTRDKRDEILGFVDSIKVVRTRNAVIIRTKK